MFKELFPNVFFFESQNFGSNVFLLKAGKNALIDSSAEQNSELLLRGLEGLGLSAENIGLIAHTHGHADHFGCDFLFKKAEILMHSEDAKKVNEKHEKFTASNLIPTMHFPKISRFLKENETISLGELNLKVIFSPGHTKGSVCFFEPKKGLLFSGDTVFAQGFGRFDLPSGNLQELCASLKKLSGLKPKILFPGHGPESKNASECLVSAIAETRGYL